MNEPETIKIDDVEYVKAGNATRLAKQVDGMDYVIVRSRDAGCFAGYLECQTGAEVKLINARRLWYWNGAASLSQLATDGVANPKECKFPCEVSNIRVLGVCEIIMATEKSRESIKGVPVWKK
ncbi:MAG: hypothetical protein GY841_04295 [FCB group bacterium]|nr:hypothetical protein [FCB group bacterium]